jgi:hypothetical protein
VSAIGKSLSHIRQKKSGQLPAIHLDNERLPRSGYAIRLIQKRSLCPCLLSLCVLCCTSHRNSP